MSLFQDIHAGYQKLGISGEAWARFEAEAGLDLSDVLYLDECFLAFCAWRDKGLSAPSALKGFIYPWAREAGRSALWIEKHTED